ncbi:MAG: conserved hypothetical signal peptide protein [Ramlibacter sp.]|nr:conserved hypothetical signal peptide protein [Ramlibacter sp.]
MKYAHLIPLFAVVFAATSFAQAQGRIYRCGNTYTNDVAEAKTKSCKLVEGGYITVVEGTRVQGGSGTGNAAVKIATVSSAGARVDSADQKARDSDARQILESELKKAEARQAELVKEYNNGEPEKQGAEGRNYQKYLDRVAELKASIARNENDIAGIKRELGRVPAAK